VLLLLLLLAACCLPHPNTRTQPDTTSNAAQPLTITPCRKQRATHRRQGHNHLLRNFSECCLLQEMQLHVTAVIYLARWQSQLREAWPLPDDYCIVCSSLRALPTL
jgi:hypothetical protein